MESGNAIHHTYEDHPYTHVFTAPDPAGSVVYRTDTLQQLVCSPRGAAAVKSVLSGEANAEGLPAAVREFLFRAPSQHFTAATATPLQSIDPLHTLYLLPTLDCQLRCGYCRITRMQGAQEGFHLSPQSACDAIDRFFGHEPAQRKRTVVFFGGEPLLVRETVLAAVRRIRGGPGRDNTDIVLQTNAMAIDDETAEFLGENDVFVLASIDGPKEVHDSHRRFANGEGSYLRTVAGYENARRHGCRVGVSSTLANDTAERFMATLPSFLDELRPDDFGIGTHLHPLSGARSPHQAPPLVAARVLTDAYVLARERGLYFQQMCQRIAPFVHGTRRRYACAGCGGKVVVAPNGSAGLCEYNAPEGRSYVPIEEFSAGTVPDLPEWTSRSPLNTRECLKCPALATCGGGCAYDSQVLLGDALKFDPWLCETNVEVMRWVLHDLLSQVQDRVREEDFHVVTPQERALVLGNIVLGGPGVPMPQVFDYGETADATHCTAEGCGE